MATVEELEARVKRMEEIEAIKRLKYKYLRGVDTKQWDELAECFTDDATTAYGDGKYSFKGKDAIMKFLRESLGPTMISAHQCHHPEIELTSDTTAKGTWALQDYLIMSGANLSLRGAGFYYDEYVKINGEWKIKHTGYRRIFEEVWDRKETKSLKLTASMFPLASQ
jgi:bile-acid 7alpha-dehydratase